MERKIKKGDRVKVTGIGRTGQWGKAWTEGERQGTVTRATKRSVFVAWDETTFEDQMSIDEVKLA